MTCPLPGDGVRFNLMTLVAARSGLLDGLLR